MHFVDAQRAMDHIGRGLIAGFIATLALSVLVDPIAAMIRAASPGSSVLSWMFHVFAGTLMWGASFACVHDLIGGPSWLRGIIFGCAIWLAATAILLSTRMFGAQPSFAVMLVIFSMSIVYGAIVGAVYGLLRKRDVPSSSRSTSTLVR